MFSTLLKQISIFKSHLFCRLQMLSISTRRNCCHLVTLCSIDTHFDASTQTAFDNIVEKEEIAHNEQFLLSPQCFLLNQIIISLFVYIFDVISLFCCCTGRVQNWHMRKRIVKDKSHYYVAS